AQLFIQNPGNRKIIGTVGELQFEVIQFRLLQEYGASCRFRSMTTSKANWVSSEDPEVLKRFLYSNSSKIAYDKEMRPVFLATNQWDIDYAIQQFPEIRFHESSEWDRMAAKV